MTLSVKLYVNILLKSLNFSLNYPYWSILRIKKLKIKKQQDIYNTF